ncbi:zonadhesin-like [Sander lucioperca]|uniref:zonadhesin-like n=1 Tax=Sander lucioperca TaxID=283035 RepID=UPI001653B900|nr:zonadhesin-like [Sander lucioperca]
MGCTLCTVTGPTVIDIHGHVNSVQDRCVYSLIKTPSIPDIQVYTTFQERRRKDVSFLDRVILSLDNPGVNIYLEQGGKVQLDNITMALNATAQLVHSVELSKDQTGVTAKMSHLNYTMTVFFDGYTAQIYIKGPIGQAPLVEGLCGNSSRPFSEARLSESKTTGCEMQYEDTANSTINCNTMTEHCNVLKEAPFTACHSNIDPEPYVMACTNTLCKYPAVDGLSCQFLEAYARACSLYSNLTLDGWRSNANCYPQAFCQDRFCSAHEFCGENSNGDGTRCYCRALFASAYTAQNSLGGVVNCSSNARTLTLVGCLLEDQGISYTNLHLYEKACLAQMDPVTHMVTITFDIETNPCGTIIKMNDSQVINQNAVILETTSEELIGFTCPFVIPDITIDFSVTFKVKSGSSSSSVAYVTSGVWNYTVTMMAYTDPGHTQAVGKDTEVHLNQKVWFELKADGLDDKNVALVTDSCFATNTPSPNSSLIYDLIMNGCANPTDKTMTVESNGQGTANYFSFNMFQFYGNTGDIYLQCRLNLCLKENNSCAPYGYVKKIVVSGGFPAQKLK